MPLFTSARADSYFGEFNEGKMESRFHLGIEFVLIRRI
jgi:hypothetical protein